MTYMPTPNPVRKRMSQMMVLIYGRGATSIKMIMVASVLATNMLYNTACHAALWETTRRNRTAEESFMEQIEHWDNFRLCWGTETDASVSATNMPYDTACRAVLWDTTDDQDEPNCGRSVCWADRTLRWLQALLRHWDFRLKHDQKVRT